MTLQSDDARPASTSSLHTELADALRRRRVMLLSLAAQSEHELLVVSGSSGDGIDSTRGENLAALTGRLDEPARREIDAIHGALERIGAGRYGRCEACDGPIETPRLLAVPTARWCTTCAASVARPEDEPAAEVPGPARPAAPMARGNAPRHAPRSRPRA